MPHAFSPAKRTCLWLSGPAPRDSPWGHLGISLSWAPQGVLMCRWRKTNCSKQKDYRTHVGTASYRSPQKSGKVGLLIHTWNGVRRGQQGQGENWSVLLSCCPFSIRVSHGISVWVADFFFFFFSTLVYLFSLPSGNLIWIFSLKGTNFIDTVSWIHILPSC